MGFVVGRGGVHPYEHSGRQLVVMSLEGTALWGTIEEIARGEGVQLFDVELPSDTRRGGALRVYITKPQVAQAGSAAGRDEAEVDLAGDTEATPRGGISFEECVRVSKRILDYDEQQEIIPGNCTLEVSSPGINRKLRLPAHFEGAVGERVRVKFRSAETGATVVVHGVIRHAAGGTVQLESEPKREVVSIPLSEIKEARVDFKF